MGREHGHAATLHARAIAVRKRSAQAPGKSAAAGFRASRGESVSSRLYRPNDRGWVKVKNPTYWRRDAELEAMQRSRERRMRRGPGPGR